MRQVIFAWANASEEVFERIVPLRFVGQRNLDLGFSSQFTVIFLEGLHLLRPQYRAELERLGYSLVDADKIFSNRLKEFHVLQRFGSYETRCFLRWLVLKDLFFGEPAIHFDGDVVFNTDPKVLTKAWHDQTFVMHGCPALSVINDREWLICYENELKLFCSDIESYSKSAWQERKGWQESQFKKWAGARFREIISSDQDLISHLIHTNKIPQANPVEVLSRTPDLIFFDQPLSLDLYNHSTPYVYHREKGIDYLNEKRIGFWHMQSDFSHYLLRMYFRNRCLWGFSRTRLTREYHGVEFQLYRLWRRYRFGRLLDRSLVYKFYFEAGNFASVFNDLQWWKPGVFASPDR